jgi:hypothetical protein
MKSLSLSVGKIYETNYCFGVVLSDGFEAMEDDVRSFVLAQSQAINTFVQSQVPRLEVLYIQAVESFKREIFGISIFLYDAKLGYSQAEFYADFEYFEYLKTIF